MIINIGVWISVIGFGSFLVLLLSSIFVIFVLDFESDHQIFIIFPVFGRLSLFLGTIGLLIALAGLVGQLGSA